MIHIDRAAVTPPEELTGGDSCAGFKELKKTLDFYAVVENHQKPYDKYKAYKLPGVLKALTQLFHGKCAYCESNIGATQPTDIEHFRPKGGYIVRDKTTKSDAFKRPGYYWLAARWENLVPSCIDCNRERTQEFPNGQFGKVGKANKFPIANEAKRAMKPDEEEREKHFLLHPCEDNPDEHLEFTEEGVVRPALINRKTPSRRGKVSIEVYGLLRNGLVQKRRSRAIEVLGAIKLIKNLEILLDRYPDDPLIERQLQEEIGRLKGYLDPKQEYSGMTRQLVKKVYGRIPG